MAKVSSVQRELKRQKLHDKYKARREDIKKQLKNPELSAKERYELVKKLSQFPKNSSKVRLHNRCELTGRPKGYYRKFKMSRIMLRKLASEGKLPGVRKASW